MLSASLGLRSGARFLERAYLLAAVALPLLEHQVQQLYCLRDFRLWH
jgi:hypothetical protein